MAGEKLICERCGKKLSRKTARKIGDEIMCSSCLFPPMKSGETWARVNNSMFMTPRT